MADGFGPKVRSRKAVLSILLCPVRQTEKRVATFGGADKLRRERRRDPFTRDAEEKLSRRLRARVRIVRRRRGGRIEIAFGSEEELMGLYERLARA